VGADSVPDMDRLLTINDVGVKMEILLIGNDLVSRGRMAKWLHEETVKWRS
jgi:hypothetical protein